MNTPNPDYQLDEVTQNFIANNVQILGPDKAQKVYDSDNPVDRFGQECITRIFHITPSTAPTPAPPIPEPEITPQSTTFTPEQIEQKLSEEQKQFIQAKVQTLGPQAAKTYDRDSLVDLYAQHLLLTQFGYQTTKKTRAHTPTKTKAAKRTRTRTPKKAAAKTKTASKPKPENT